MTQFEAIQFKAIHM